MAPPDQDCWFFPIASTALPPQPRPFPQFHPLVAPARWLPLRTSLCARSFGTLLVVEHKRLVAVGATQLHTRVVYRQRFAVGGYDTMGVANDLAILLEIKVPSVCIDLLRERRIRRAGRGLLLFLAVAVLHPVRHLLAVCACQLLVERVQPVGFGIDTGPGRELCARAELRIRDIERPGTHDRVCGEGMAPPQQRSQTRQSG